MARKSESKQNKDLTMQNYEKESDKKIREKFWSSDFQKKAIEDRDGAISEMNQTINEEVTKVEMSDDLTEDMKKKLIKKLVSHKKAFLQDINEIEFSNNNEDNDFSQGTDYPQEDTTDMNQPDEDLDHLYNREKSSGYKDGKSKDKTEKQENAELNFKDFRKKIKLVAEQAESKINTKEYKTQLKNDRDSAITEINLPFNEIIDQIENSDLGEGEKEVLLETISAHKRRLLKLINNLETEAENPETISPDQNKDGHPDDQERHPTEIDQKGVDAQRIEEITKQINEETGPVSPETATQKGKETVYLIDIGKVVEAMALREAEKRLEEYKNGKKGILRKLYTRMAEKQFLSKFYHEALMAIRQNRNLMAEIETRILAKSTDTGIADKSKSWEHIDNIINQFKEDLVEENEKGTTMSDTEVNNEVSLLVRRYALGLMSRDDFDREVEKKVVKKIKDKGGHFSDDHSFEAQGESTYVSNLASMAEKYKTDNEKIIKELTEKYGEDQKENIARLLPFEMDFQIQLGTKQKDLVETKPQGVLKWYERFVDWTQNPNLGLDSNDPRYSKKRALLSTVLANPLTYALIPVGIAAGASLFSKRTAKYALAGGIGIATGGGALAAVGAAGILGGAYAAFRRSKHDQDDRGMDLRRRALGAESGGKKTDIIREFAYSLMNIEDTIEELDSLDLTSPTEVQRAKEILQNFYARKELSNDPKEDKQFKVDLFSISGEEGANRKSNIAQMTALKRKVKQIETALGVKRSDFDADIDSIKSTLRTEIQKKDKEFDSFRKKQMWKAGLMGGAMGLVFGEIGLESVNGIKHLMGTEHASTTPVEYLLGLVARHHEAPAPSLVDMSIPGGKIRVPENMPENVKSILPRLFDAEGHLTSDGEGILRGEGFDLNTVGGGPGVAHEVAPSEYFKGLDYGKHLREDWHDEAGKKFSSIFGKAIQFEGKQQMLHLGHDQAGGAFMDVAGVLKNLGKNLDGAFEKFGTNPDGSVDSKLAHLRDQLTEWQSQGKLAEHLQAVFILNEADSKEGVNVLIQGADADGHINFGQAISKLFTNPESFKDGHVPFKHIELRIDGHTLATVSGNEITGNLMGETAPSSILEIIPAPVEEAVTDTIYDIPPVLPFYPRLALELPGEVKKREKKFLSKEEKAEAKKIAAATENTETKKTSENNTTESTATDDKVVEGDVAIADKNLDVLIKDIDMSEGKLRLGSSEQTKIKSWLLEMTPEQADSFFPEKQYNKDEFYSESHDQLVEQKLSTLRKLALATLGTSFGNDWKQFFDKIGKGNTDRSNHRAALLLENNPAVVKMIKTEDQELGKTIEELIRKNKIRKAAEITLRRTEEWKDLNPTELDEKIEEKKAKLTSENSEGDEEDDNEEEGKEREGVTPEETQTINAEIKTLKNEREGLAEKAFQEMTRKTWKNIVVHGIGKNEFSDLDGEACLGLLKIAGIDVGGVKFVEKGQSTPGAINFDTGNKDGISLMGDTIFLDHHGENSRQESSATKVTFEALAGLGLLESSPAINKLVEFVTKSDNLDFPLDKLSRADFNNFPKTLWGLKSGFKKQAGFQRLWDFMQKHPEVGFSEPLSDGLLKELVEVDDKKVKDDLETEIETQKTIVEGTDERFEKLKENGFIIESGEDGYGNIVVSLLGRRGSEENAVPGRIEEVKAHDCNCLITYNESENNLTVNTDREIEFKLPEGMAIRGRMWILEGDRQAKKEAFGRITLRQVIEGVTGKKIKDLKLEGKLAEFLDKERPRKSELEKKRDSRSPRNRTERSTARPRTKERRDNAA
ncbi:MAG: hypothetical protein WCV92_00790 [Candidatus Buchananbacteria bacterium]